MENNFRKFLDSKFRFRNKFSSANISIFTYFVIIAISGSLFLELPFFYKDFSPMNYIDSLFTTVSALCVTGLCTIEIEQFNNAGLFVLMLIIELGGLGLIAFFTIYLVFPSQRISLGSRQSIKDFFISDVETNHKSIVKQIVFYSLAIQLVGGIFLGMILEKSGEENYIFYGGFLAVSAFCNAGFAPWNDSLHRFDSNIPFNCIIMFLILFGGLGFTVMQDVLYWCGTTFKKKFFGKGRIHKISLHSKVVFLMTIILVSIPSVIYLILEWNYAFKNLNICSKIMNAIFQSVTCRTAGFELVGEGTFTPASTFISEIIMAIGGNPGSMAGGIKTTTIFLVFCNAIKSEDEKGRLSLTMFNRDIAYEDTNKASSVFIKAMIFIGTIVFLLFLSEHDRVMSGEILTSDISFEAISAIGTAGLSRGITSSLNVFSKIILIIAMYGGRTGIITLSLVLPTKINDIKRFVEYPREEILVG